jgi:hypothetical protein
MSGLKHLVLEYLPHAMDGYEFRPARIDGHYSDEKDARDIAALWAEDPLHKESRIVVVKVTHEAKAPAHWLHGAA